MKVGRNIKTRKVLTTPPEILKHCSKVFFLRCITLLLTEPSHEYGRALSP